MESPRAPRLAPDAWQKQGAVGQQWYATLQVDMARRTLKLHDSESLWAHQPPQGKLGTREQQNCPAKRAQLAHTSNTHLQHFHAPD